MQFGNVQEIMEAVGFAAFVSLATMMACSFALSYFVGLRSPPAKRALLTVGASYIITVVAWVFSGPAFLSWVWPVGAIPAALALYGYLCWHYGRTWFNDDAGMPEGIAPAETDWRNGLLKLLALIVAAIVVVGVKTFIRLA